jgi:hypothetical protein
MSSATGSMLEYFRPGLADVKNVVPTSDSVQRRSLKSVDDVTPVDRKPPHADTDVQFGTRHNAHVELRR